jgi:hypothetical protein
MLISCSENNNKSNNLSQTESVKNVEIVKYSPISELKEIEGNWKNDFDKIIVNSKTKTFQWNDGAEQKVVFFNKKNVSFRVLLYLGNSITKDFLVNLNKEKDKLELVISSNGQTEHRFYDKVK